MLMILSLFEMVQCFFGYKLMRLWIGLSGGLVGGVIGGVLGALSGQTVVIAIAAIAGIVLGAFVAYKVYLIGILVIGLFNGALIGLVIGLMMGLYEEAIIMMLICSILAGVLVVVLVRPAIIIMTSITAGVVIGGTICFYTFTLPVGIIVGVILMSLGIWFQFKTTSIKKIFQIRIMLR